MSVCPICGDPKDESMKTCGDLSCKAKMAWRTRREEAVPKCPICGEPVKEGLKTCGDLSCKAKMAWRTRRKKEEI